MSETKCVTPAAPADVERGGVARFWKPTAIVACIVGAAAIAVDLTDLWDWFGKANGPDLVAVAWANEYEDAPFPVDGGSDDFTAAKTPYKGYIRLRLENAGDLTATNVRLVVGTEGVAKVVWNNDPTPVFTDFNSDFELGDVAAERSADIELWMDSLLYLNRNGLFLSDNSGKTPIDLRPGVTEPSGFWNTPTTLALCVAVAFTIYLYNAYRRAELSDAAYQGKIDKIEAVAAARREADHEIAALQREKLESDRASEGLRRRMFHISRRVSEGKPIDDLLDDGKPFGTVLNGNADEDMPTDH